MEIVKYLVETAHANVDDIDVNGETCLFYAGEIYFCVYLIDMVLLFKLNNIYLKTNDSSQQ